MIVYLDTSALLKLYVAEPGSRRVHEAVETAAMRCTHLVTYTEVRAALARAVRTNRLAEDEHAGLVRAFDSDWPALEIVGVDESLVHRAAEHAEHYGLRGYDSLQLAAAERTFDGAGRPAGFRLMTFDAELHAGAEWLGIPSLPCSE